MMPPICAICDADFDPSEGGLISFQETKADQIQNARLAQPGFTGHPPNAVWFCPQHYSVALPFATLTRPEAMQKIEDLISSKMNTVANKTETEIPEHTHRDMPS